MNVLLGTALVFKSGGVRTHILTLKKTLEQHGNKASLLFLPNISFHDVIAAGLKGLGRREYAYKELVKARAKRTEIETEKLLQKSTFDLIHAQDVIYASGIINKKRPVILTAHGAMSREAKVPYKSKEGSPFHSYIVDMERKAYNYADHIITVFSGQKEIIVNEYNVDPQKITVIWNAVNVPDLQNFSSNYSGRPYFFIPKNLVPYSGIDVAIKAFSLIKNKDYELWIAGDGPERNTLKKLADKLKISHRIRFLGSLDYAQVLQHMYDADGVMIPSVPVSGVVEGSSLSALEAMSIGKTVIASDLGGLKEVIIDKQNGLLFQPGNIEELASLISKAIEDKEYMTKIGKNARVYIETSHNTQHWLGKVLEVYNKVL